MIEGNIYLLFSIKLDDDLYNTLLPVKEKERLNTSEKSGFYRELLPKYSLYIAASLDA
jgi:hypothetical protein